MPTASAEGTVLRLASGAEIAVRLSGMTPAEGSVYQAWLGDGDEVRPIGSFQIPAADEQVVLRPGEAPAGALIIITERSPNDELRTPDHPILAGRLSR